MGLRSITYFFLISISLLSLESREFSSRFLPAQKNKTNKKNSSPQFDTVVIPRPPKFFSKPVHRSWLKRKGKSHFHANKTDNKKIKKKMAGHRRRPRLTQKSFLALEAAAQEYTERYRSARFSKERKELREKTKIFLEKNWPQKKYRFENDCALFFIPSRQKKHRPFWNFQIGKNGLCSPHEIRLRKRSPNSEKRKSKKISILQLLKTAKTPVSFQADLHLEKIRLIPSGSFSISSKGNKKQKGRIAWKWKLLQLSFQDPYLQVLYQKYRPRRLPKIRNPLQKARDLPLFFSVLAKEKKRKSPGELEPLVERYLPKGTSLLFDRDCPLRFLGGLRETQEGVLQFQVEAACLAKKRRRFVILLPKNSPFINFFQALRPKSLFSAYLRFQEILWEGNQFYPLWDTILKPKVFSKPNGLPLRFFSP